MKFGMMVYMNEDSIEFNVNNYSVDYTLDELDFSQFKMVNPDDVKAISQPSIVLKGGMEQLGLVRLTPKEIEQYLWIHPLLPRGIEIKANRMTSRGYRIEPYDESPEAKLACEKMWDLLKNSGGEIFLNSWIQDGYAFGNGYVTLLPDQETGEIVLLSKEHPVFFRIARKKKDTKKDTEGFLNQYARSGDWSHEYGIMKINPVTKKPTHYTQVVFASNKNEVVPTGTEIKSDQVGHLVFDTWGDEAEGISLVQYVWTILKYIMNIEEAGAEAIWRSGFTQKKITTNIRNERDLKTLAKNLEKINAKDSIILPEGTDVQNLVPGETEFVETHDVFMTLVAMRLGVPKPILTLDGSDINKATMQELMKDMIYDIRADEIKVKRTVEEQIFVPACKSIFNDDFDKIPKFFFNDFVETKEHQAEVFKSIAQSLNSLLGGQNPPYQLLKDAGLQEEADKLLRYALKHLEQPDITGLDEKVKKDVERVPSKEPAVEETDESSDDSERRDIDPE